jgi:hypothetical protein
MKITFIGHAAILVEAGGVSVLSDPWWRGPCFGAQWWIHPEPFVQPVETRQVDYIYLSHGHADHFHAGTLSSFARDTKVLVSATTGLAPAVRELGFPVIEVRDDETITLGEQGLKCRIVETHAHDTLMTLDDGHEVCVNLNDALHSAPRAVQDEFIMRLRALHPRMAYVFCGYGIASHFPNCYEIPNKDRVATTARRQAHFNREWSRLIGELKPVYGFPFAADVVFLEDDLFWANEATHNSERPTTVFQQEQPGSPVIVADIAPGFVVENSVVTAPVLRQPLRAEHLRVLCAEQIERANRYGRVDDQGVQQVVDLLNGHLDHCREALLRHQGDYRFLIRLRNGALGIVVEKRGATITISAQPDRPDAEFDVVYTTRLAYLRWALTRAYGDEILFVGSGGIFDYIEATAARENLHRQLIQLIRRHSPAPQGFGARSSVLRAAKQLIKRALGRRPERDLYDLVEWTVFRR